MSHFCLNVPACLPNSLCCYAVHRNLSHWILCCTFALLFVFLIHWLTVVSDLCCLTGGKWSDRRDESEARRGFLGPGYPAARSHWECLSSCQWQGRGYQNTPQWHWAHPQTPRWGTLLMYTHTHTTHTSAQSQLRNVYLLGGVYPSLPDHLCPPLWELEVSQEFVSHSKEAFTLIWQNNGQVCILAPC